jgi:hypothetical protein
VQEVLGLDAMLQRTGLASASLANDGKAVDASNAQAALPAVVQAVERHLKPIKKAFDADCRSRLGRNWQSSRRCKTSTSRSWSWTSPKGIEQVNTVRRKQRENDTVDLFKTAISSGSETRLSWTTVPSSPSWPRWPPERLNRHPQARTTMSFAITGLENANEFYSQHYLDEIVERDLKPCSTAGRNKAQQPGGARAHGRRRRLLPRPRAFARRTQGRRPPSAADRPGAAAAYRPSATRSIATRPGVWPMVACRCWPCTATPSTTRCW